MKNHYFLFNYGKYLFLYKNISFRYLKIIIFIYISIIYLIVTIMLILYVFLIYLFLTAWREEVS